MKSWLNLLFILVIGLSLLLLMDAIKPITFLIILIGMLGSFVGTLAGGGGLITLPAMLLLGVPIHFCIATNKFSSGIASLSSVFVILRTRKISLKDMVPFIVFSFVGGGVGAFVTSMLSDQLLNFIAFCLLVFAFIVSIQSKKLFNESEAVNSKLKGTLSSKIMTFLIGVYDGGFGPGSSTFSILYFLKSKNTYVTAAQMSRVLNFGSCLAAFIIFYKTGFLNWEYAISMATGSIIGTQIAIKVMPKIPLQFARGFVTTILILLMVQVALEIV